MFYGYPYYGPYYGGGPHYGGGPYYGGGGYPNNYYGGRINYGRCFSGDSLVKLSNGKDKRIDSINIGDQILTIDQSRLVSTDVIMILDKHISKKTLFYKFVTCCGNEISLTEYHLIPIISSNKNLNYKFAKEIQLGDLLLNSELKSCSVINITNEIKKGYSAPLTMKGTLLVNQILASSFAHVNNHHLAQFSMFPFRCYYQLTRFFHLNDPFYIYNSQDLNWFIKIIFYLTHYFRPDLVVLSQF